MTYAEIEFDRSYINIRDFFNNCQNLTVVNFIGWRNQDIINSNNIFYNCFNLVDILDNGASLNVENFHSLNLMGAGGTSMFRNCNNLKDFALIHPSWK
jgi:hypothetical protein